MTVVPIMPNRAVSVSSMEQRLLLKRYAAVKDAPTLSSGEASAEGMEHTSPRNMLTLELITTFFIYANLKWSKQILECNAGATRGKFHLANFMRFVDGLAFLFINTTLLLQATQVLSAFLNFAALQFLSSIDNVALHLARDGYLSESLEDIAGDVLLMKIARNHNERLQKLDTVMLTIVYLIVLIAWCVVMFAI